MRTARWTTLCLSVAAWAGQADLADHELLLEQIKDEMASNLARVPNYTCLETIERSQIHTTSRNSHITDTVHLEVAVVNHKELFAWPGAVQIEERGIGELVGGGTTTTGDFTLHARTVFLSYAPVFTYAGEEVRRGRRTVRFDYSISLRESNYLMKVGNKQARVAYHGSFWADRESLEVARLEVRADEIPSELGVAEAITEIEYGKVRVGNSDFLLPGSVQFAMRRVAGEEYRNRTTFTRCRQYVGEAFVSFDMPSTERPADAGKQAAAMELPPGLVFEARLKKPIDGKTAAVGDAIEATVQEPVQTDGKAVVPKGAVLIGRIRRLQKHSGRDNFFVVGLEFTTLQFGGQQAAFFGEIREVGTKPGSGDFFRRPRAPAIAIVPDLPGVGAFLIPGKSLHLAQGFRMVWRSAPNSPTTFSAAPVP
ncbi:MAG: hypothetical protein HY238_26895 [Acidobacteria bacterium]|nr:hypothetical protein [Acidobacteriota bacterium]